MQALPSDSAASRGSLGDGTCKRRFRRTLDSSGLNRLPRTSVLDLASVTRLGLLRRLKTSSSRFSSAGGAGKVTLAKTSLESDVGGLPKMAFKDLAGQLCILAHDRFHQLLVFICRVPSLFQQLCYQTVLKHGTGSQVRRCIEAWSNLPANVKPQWCEVLETTK